MNSHQSEAVIISVKKARTHHLQELRSYSHLLRMSEQERPLAPRWGQQRAPQKSEEVGCRLLKAPRSLGLALAVLALLVASLYSLAHTPPSISLPPSPPSPKLTCLVCRRLMLYTMMLRGRGNNRR